MHAAPPVLNPPNFALREMTAALASAAVRPLLGGGRYPIVEDPGGNHLRLMSPSDPARKSAPPAP
jgi:hypothetical protein